MDYLIPDKAYNVLKWVGLILCPALAALVGAVGPAWGLPHVDSMSFKTSSGANLVITVDEPIE